MRTTENSKSTSQWKADFKEAIRSREQLETILNTPIPDTGYPLFLPLPLVRKIKELGKDSPLWKQFIPSHEEEGSQGEVDPIGDHLHAKGSGIIHRYKNRLLFSPTEVCPVLCRYCFRKNELLSGDDTFKANSKALIHYLQTHPEVEEVILTGGDPLILSDDKLSDLLSELSAVNTVKMIRFHSRTPVILPSRIDESFIEMINSFTPRFDLITLVIHTNHTSEWTPEFLYALKKLKQTDVLLLSQSVLLKGVNDEVLDLKVLFNSLIKNGVKPYYLHHPDSVKGGMHFTLPLKEGQRVYQELKKEVSGFILPRYVIELPHGNGKTFAQRSSYENQWLTKDGHWMTWNHP